MYDKLEILRTYSYPDLHGILIMNCVILFDCAVAPVRVEVLYIKNDIFSVSVARKSYHSRSPAYYMCTGVAIVIVIFLGKRNAGMAINIVRV